VGRHEPNSALDGGGALGLDCLVEICAQAADFLRPDGFLGIETGGELSSFLVASCFLIAHSGAALKATGIWSIVRSVVFGNHITFPLYMGWHLHALCFDEEQNFTLKAIIFIYKF
jgi:methylase of polypeptide subunit release factors